MSCSDWCEMHQHDAAQWQLTRPDGFAQWGTDRLEKHWQSIRDNFKMPQPISHRASVLNACLFTTIQGWNVYLLIMSLVLRSALVASAALEGRDMRVHPFASQTRSGWRCWQTVWRQSRDPSSSCSIFQHDQFSSQLLMFCGGISLCAFRYQDNSVSWKSRPWLPSVHLFSTAFPLWGHEGTRLEPVPAAFRRETLEMFTAH